MKLAIIACLTLPGLAGAASAIDSPALESREPCPVSEGGDYAQYVARQMTTWREESAAAARQGMAMRDEASIRAALLTSREYAERHRGRGVACERISYRSDGHRVYGYVWRSPKRMQLPQPILIFNRGGAQEFSKLRPNTQFGFYRFVKAGFVVVASQYRGNDGGDGRDEFGGADVNDVLRLVDIARTLDGVDPDNVFALGYSRGGMQTLLAAKRSAGFRAAATVGLPADFLASLEDNPGSSANFAALIPEFATDPEGTLKARSALYWTDAIQLPLLLIAGSADSSVRTHTHSIALARRLGELGKSYELVVYDGDSHGVMLNARDRDDRIIQWFRRFQKSALR